jgi:NADH-quinone oxidoreductase subunit N
MPFTYFVSAADWGRIAPELVLVGMTLLIMLVDLLLPRAGGSSPSAKLAVGVPLAGTLSIPRGRRDSGPSNWRDSGPSNYIILPALSLLGLVLALVATIVLFIVGDHQNAFNQMIGSDQGSLYAYIIILSASALGILLSPDYLKRINLPHLGEYYALMLLATIGMMLMAAATSFLTVFLGLEMLSLALYILCGFVTRRQSSQEAGMKYFLLSSFASAFLLYGVALAYGATGSTSFNGIKQFLATQPTVSTHLPSGLAPNALQYSAVHSSTLLLIAMGLLTVGFAFKVSAIPFQAWTPDVYDGAPAPVTAFMSVGTKAAALIAFARVFDVALFQVRLDWLPLILAITILTIVGGNILALVQSNVKRLLAYSSIAHAGYLLIGVVAGGEVVALNGTLIPGGILGLSAILFYLLSYTFLNLGAFGIVSILERADNTGNDLSDIRGLWYRRPVLAGLLAFFMLSLAGFPPMAGFAAKYYLFYVALQSGHPELLIIGVLASVLGMYYYLRVIAVMFMEKEPEAVVARFITPAATSPTPTAGKRASGKLGASGSPAKSKATAVVVKKTAASKTKTDVAVEQSSEEKPTIGWTTWVALGTAGAGTLLMGTVLPFWLVNLAQQAAQMMFK